MCFSSLVLSRRPKLFKKRPKTLKKTLTPIGSCRDLHIFHIWSDVFSKPLSEYSKNLRMQKQCPIYFLLTPDQPPFKGGRYLNKFKVYHTNRFWFGYMTITMSIARLVLHIHTKRCWWQNGAKPDQSWIGIQCGTLRVPIQMTDVICFLWDCQNLEFHPPCGDAAFRSDLAPFRSDLGPFGRI